MLRGGFPSLSAEQRASLVASDVRGVSAADMAAAAVGGGPLGARIKNLGQKVKDRLPSFARPRAKTAI